MEDDTVNEPELREGLAAMLRDMIQDDEWSTDVAALQEEQRSLDGVVRVLGIEDDSITPAEEAARILAENEALHSKLADCQAAIEHKGHDAGCPASQCQYSEMMTGDYRLCCARSEDEHALPAGRSQLLVHHFMAGECSDACGHDRCLGVNHD